MQGTALVSTGRARRSTHPRMRSRATERPLDGTPTPFPAVRHLEHWVPCGRSRGRQAAGAATGHATPTPDHRGMDGAAAGQVPLPVCLSASHDGDHAATYGRTLDSGTSRDGASASAHAPRGVGHLSKGAPRGRRAAVPRSATRGSRAHAPAPETVRAVWRGRTDKRISQCAKGHMRSPGHDGAFVMRCRCDHDLAGDPLQQRCAFPHASSLAGRRRSGHAPPRRAAHLVHAAVVQAVSLVRTTHHGFTRHSRLFFQHILCHHVWREDRHASL